MASIRNTCLLLWTSLVIFASGHTAQINVNLPRSLSSKPSVCTSTLIANGNLIDTKTKKSWLADILVRDGRVAAIKKAGSIPKHLASQVVDATGLFVTPGLVDLHTHIYWGATYWGIEADPVAARSGVTTWNDAGSSGAYTFPGLRIKVRMDSDATSGSGLEGLKRARQVADKTKLPIMVHIGHTPPVIEDIAEYLGKGDILTHCFNGHENRLIDNSGKLRPVVHTLKSKGVHFDIGHGGGSFDYTVAEKMIADGFMPDSVSSDLHQISTLGSAQDLPTVLSKLLNLGIPLEELIAKATLVPARIIGHPELGRLQVGGPADIAIFRLEHGQFHFTDNAGNKRNGTMRIVNTHTFRDGIPMPHVEAEPAASWAIRDAGVVSGVKPPTM
ncbi:amidohydrolase [Basidiobolus meristosporus CBS 931.73]|uniref:Amidohydrolase n=1 Tax=Basidiobolus meristosporus CBS 931.73 TaxID=1314790 RepID=A0A1Y1YDT4_9FUNG|nr:amidohydrolase [Basidiobolus meristosporus CBS 931.73]|eukprot:ORX95774.1 amidohydrolase [Basidiobolus meristosporus CBS 931.73]